ncbi:MAG: hypothetical protein ACT4OM_10655 [Actinomycetota bacterium]
MIEPNDHDRFLLRQRFRFVVNIYEFSLPQEQDRPGTPFLYVRQKPFKFKEDIRFFEDAEMSRPYMKIVARQRFDPKARYDVTMADGTPIGQVQKVFGQSLLRSTYLLYDATGEEAATITEEKLWVALFRRVVGLVPVVGEFGNLLPIPYHFTFLRGERVLGSHRRQLFKLRDHYLLDLSPDTERSLDRRLVLAIAVGMDALQAR